MRSCGISGQVLLNLLNTEPWDTIGDLSMGLIVLYTYIDIFYIVYLYCIPILYTYIEPSVKPRLSEIAVLAPSLMPVQVFWDLFYLYTKQMSSICQK